jgi:molybdopterin-guanine dinucleotide biosynthesis protein A
MIHELRVSGVVLCGGESRRMGSPKPWLSFGNEPLLCRVVRRVSQAIRPVVVAARADQDLPALPADIQVVHDEIENGGPLVGLLAAFDQIATECDAIFVCGCDQPFISPTFIRRIVGLLAGHEAVVPEHNGRIHPLTALYRCSTHGTLADMVARRALRATAFARRCDAAFPTPDAFAGVDPGLDSLKNINDPETYRQMQRIEDNRGQVGH